MLILPQKSKKRQSGVVNWFTVDDVGVICMRLDLLGAIDVLQIVGAATYDVIHMVVVFTTTEVITLAGTWEGFVA